MTVPEVLALDFDGVCCDGLHEYFETARRTHARVWPAEPTPGAELFDAFCALRPGILSGWEMPVLVSSKEGEFARLILDRWGVRLADVQGKETGVHKCENLRGLIAAWMGAHGRRPRLAFVEDRLETLQHVTTHPDLDDVALYLAEWGYNTEAARALARADARIRLLTLAEFRSGPAAWP